MTKKSLILASIIAATMMAACDDDSSKSEEYITGGSVRCSGNVSEQFVNGSWKAVVDCAADGRTCSEGVCVTGTYSCDEATYKTSCDNDTDPTTSVAESTSNNYLRYCSNGEIKYTDCSLRGTGGYCQSGACVSTSAPSCEDGAYRCSADGEHQQCSNGSWKSDPCGKGERCSAGACIADTSSNACDTEGANRCVGKAYQTCSNSVWETTKTCSASQTCSDTEGCVDKGQTSAGGCKADGSDCANGYGDTYEMDLSAISVGCGTVDGINYDDYCAEEDSLCLAEDGEPSMCVASCTKEGETSAECNVYQDGDYYDMYKCMKIGGTLVDVNYAYKECKGTSGGGSGNSNWYVCNDEDCSLSDGSTMKCGAACASAYGSSYSAWCTDTEVTCSESQPGGGSGGGSGSASCDYYDATNEYYDEAGTMTYGDVCKEQAGYDHTLCLADGTCYCVDREPSADSTCDPGETAWSQGDNVLCLVVGDDIECLFGGGSGGGSTTAGGCNAAGTDCANGRGEYTEDDPSYYSVGCGVVDGVNYDDYCAQRGKLCLAEDGEPSLCADECTKQGEESLECNSYTDGDFLDEFTCTKIDNKLIKFNTGYYECLGGSGSGGGSSAATCNSATYQESCKGNVVDYCSQGEITQIDCTEDVGDEYSCLMVNGVADCYSDAERCTKAGDTKTVCTTSMWYGTVTYDYECAKASDGKLYWSMVDAALCDDGDGYCADASTCKAAETCGANYTGKCDGQIAYTCEGGKVATLDCEEEAAYYEDDSACHVVGGVAGCYSSDMTCSKEGESSKACSDLWGLFFYVEEATCSKGDDGKLYTVSSFHYCANACNSAGTDCDAAGYDD